MQKLRLPEKNKQNSIPVKRAGIAKNVALFVSPLVTCLSVAASPTIAASLQLDTHAQSETSVTIYNFSHTPYAISTFPSTNTETYTLLEYQQNISSEDQTAGSEATASARNNRVVAQALADATFVATTRPIANNFNLAQAHGIGREYLGIAESKSAVVGSFFLAPQAANNPVTFSFDFFGSINLDTESNSGAAYVSADLDLLLYGGTDPDLSNQTLLDFFSFSSFLKTPGKEIPSPIVWNASDNFNVRFNPTGVYGSAFLKQETLSVGIDGTYQRKFDSPIYLTLKEIKKNKAVVQAPEPSSTLALIVFSGLVCVWFGTKKKASGGLGSNSFNQCEKITFGQMVNEAATKQV